MSPHLSAPRYLMCIYCFNQSFSETRGPCTLTLAQQRGKSVGDSQNCSPSHAERVPSQGRTRRLSCGGPGVGVGKHAVRSSESKLVEKVSQASLCAIISQPH